MKITTKKNGKTWEVLKDGVYIKHFFTLECAEAFICGMLYQAEAVSL